MLFTFVRFYYCPSDIYLRNVVGLDEWLVAGQLDLLKFPNTRMVLKTPCWNASNKNGAAGQLSFAESFKGSIAALTDGKTTIS